MTNAESKAAAILGRKGGSSKSEAKQAAARANGRKGGKPKQPKPCERHESFQLFCGDCARVNKEIRRG